MTRLHACRDKYFSSEPGYNPVSKMTEQLLTCGRMVGVKLHTHTRRHTHVCTQTHNQSHSHTGWARGTGDLWESESSGTCQISVCVFTNAHVLSSL